MQQKLHPHQDVDPCRNIVQHNAGAFRQPLQLPHRRRLDDIEGSKKYKARQKSFPREGDGNQSDQLSSDLINDDALWIFAPRSAGDLSRCGNSNQRGEHGKRARDRRAQRRSERLSKGNPKQDSRSRSPRSGAGSQIADAKESRSRGRPKRSARVGRCRECRSLLLRQVQARL